MEQRHGEDRMKLETQPGRRARRTARQLVGTGMLAALLLALAGAGATWAGKVNYYGSGQKSADCDRCSAQAEFASRIRECGADMEFVELKNGTGVVYTVSDTRLVPRLQKNVEWVKDELTRFSRSPDRYKLCTYCKASSHVYSKIDRQVALTGTGAIFLMRSTDPDAQRVLHEIFLRSKAEQSEQALRAAPSR
jgi:hypothetical protein